MAQSSTKNKKSDSALIADSTFNIISQIEKKADFLHTAFEEYVRDAEKDGREELVRIWNSMKEDEEKHLTMLKEQLLREVRDNRLWGHSEDTEKQSISICLFFLTKALLDAAIQSCILE